MSDDTVLPLNEEDLKWILAQKWIRCHLSWVSENNKEDYKFNANRFKVSYQEIGPRLTIREIKMVLEELSRRFGEREILYSAGFFMNIDALERASLFKSEWINILNDALKHDVE